MTTKLINGDCIEEMKKLEDNSVDLLFTDLPYSTEKTKCTSCAWDKPIDLEKFWKEVNRVCKINCPMFFCCNTRFGVELINSNPKNYRYEYIWSKSKKVGFLNSGKMRLTAHELIYVFYRKLPVYNVKKYHKHKFLKEPDNKEIKTSLYSNNGKERTLNRVADDICYEPPLPSSVITETRNDDGCKSLYANEKNKKDRYIVDGKLRDSEPRYEPPLPSSIIRNDEYDNREIKSRNTLKNEENYGKDYLKKKENFRAYNPNLGAKGEESNIYEPALPNSIIRDTSNYKNDSDFYGQIDRPDFMRKNNESCYEPALPDSLLEIKSVGGKHQTQKPVDLINFFIKYYSNEGDTILDPTMGSGSTGISCKELKRNFIGIELNEEIYKVAEERLK